MFSTMYTWYMHIYVYNLEHLFNPLQLEKNDRWGRSRRTENVEVLVKTSAINTYTYVSVYSLFTKFCSLILILKRQAMYVYRNIEARSRSHCCHGKGISINLYVCIQPLVFLHTKRMCCIILSSGSTIFFHLISQWHYFRKKYWM
jgi:hypothetical protein